MIFSFLKVCRNLLSRSDSLRNLAFLRLLTLVQIAYEFEILISSDCQPASTIWKPAKGYGIWTTKIRVDYRTGMFMYLYNSNISLSELPISRLPVIGMKYSYDGWCINYGGLFFKRKTHINLVKVTKKVSAEVSNIKPFKFWWNKLLLGLLRS